MRSDPNHGLRSVALTRVLVGESVGRDNFIRRALWVSVAYNVAGALLVKLFGRPDRERDAFSDRAAQVRDVGIRTAMYSRVLLVSLGVVTAFGTAIVYWVGGMRNVCHRKNRRATGDRRRDHVSRCRCAAPAHCAAAGR